MCAFVLVLCLAAGTQTLATARWARLDPRRVALRAGMAGGLLVTAAGGLLAAFPAADHLWLDGVERAVPAVRNAFLRPRERDDFEYALRDIARFSEDLRRLQDRRKAARWGDAPLSEEMLRRIELTLASHQENMAGQRAVVRILTARVRARQRYLVGIPLLLAGAALAGLCGLHLRRRSFPPGQAMEAREAAPVPPR